VIKVERPEGGDDARRMGPDFRHGDALTFHIFNRGKASRAIDLRSEAGRAELYALAETADILVHNLRPGVPEALRVDGPTLCAAFPRLIHGSISAFGHLGPMALRPGFEPLLQGYSGLSSLNGGEGDPPMRAAPSLCDQGTAMWIVIGTLALLHRRQLTGKGGMVQGSLLETALMWAGQKADAFVNTGELPERHRSGHPVLTPYEAFAAADGPVLICAGNDRLFAKLAQACGRADWVEDPRFATNRARLIHKAALFAELCPVIAGRERAHWVAVLDAAGVPVSPIHTLPEALAQPQVQALGMMQRVPGEDFLLTPLPISVDGERPRIRGGAPRLGESKG
jgi:formyl-CoA transferase